MRMSRYQNFRTFVDWYDDLWSRRYGVSPSDIVRMLQSHSLAPEAASHLAIQTMLGKLMEVSQEIVDEEELESDIYIQAACYRNCISDIINRTNSLETIRLVASYMACEGRHFVFTKTRIDQIMDTELGKVEGNAIRLPFPVMTLDVQGGNIFYAVGKIQRQLDQIMVDGRRWPILDITRFLFEGDHVYMGSCPIVLRESAPAKAAVDDDLSDIPAQLSSRGVVLAGFDGITGIVSNEDPDGPPEQAVNPFVTEFVIKCLLFLNHLSPDGEAFQRAYRESEKELRAAQKKGVLKNAHPYIYVRSGEPYSSGVKQHTPQSLAERRKLSGSWWVRGHFHHFWHGSQDGTENRERRVKWIAPYLKGEIRRGRGDRPVDKPYVVN